MGNEAELVPYRARGALVRGHPVADKRIQMPTLNTRDKRIQTPALNIETQFPTNKKHWHKTCVITHSQHENND